MTKRNPTIELFEERLRREGKYDSYSSDCAAERERRGRGGPCWDIMRAYGYSDAATERELAHDVAISDSDDTEDLEEAMARLPNTCPAGVELEWIRSHAALHRAPKKDGIVRIIVDDIRDAPSKATVIALKHWANNKTEFYKQILAVQKKDTDTKDTRGMEEVAVTLAEIEKMLAAYRESSVCCPKCGEVVVCGKCGHGVSL